MDWLTIAIIVFALGSVVSAVLLLKQSARKFDLSDEQLKKINQRNKKLDEEEEREE